MGSDPTREPPVFFQKPTDAIQLVSAGVSIDHPYPPMTKNYHYELGPGDTMDAHIDGIYDIRAKVV